MYSYLFTIFIFILVDNSQTYSIKNPTSWDYIIFAQQWPPAVCSRIKHKLCVIPANVTGWTVHGLWPTAKHSYPSFCNDSWTFNVSQIQIIESQLLVAWPNLFPEQPTYSFWKHEWMKHGTCSISVPQLDNELKYFKTAIQFHNKYNMKLLLENGGIVPDNDKTYDIKDLHKVVENQIGKKVIFECLPTKDQRKVLFNSYICTDKNLNLIDCIQKDRHCSGAPIFYMPMKRTEFLFKHFLFASSHTFKSLSSMCFTFSGLVLIVIIMMMTFVLIIFFRKQTHKRMEVYNIPPSLTEKPILNLKHGNKFKYERF